MRSQLSDVSFPQFLCSEPFILGYYGRKHILDEILRKLTVVPDTFVRNRICDKGLLPQYADFNAVASAVHLRCK